MFELICVKLKCGLTIGKKYKALTHPTKGVMVYNDLGQWIAYKLNNFKPVTADEAETINVYVR